MYFPNHLGVLKFYEMINVLYFCSVRDSITLFTMFLPIFSSSFNKDTKKDSEKITIYPSSHGLFLKNENGYKEKNIAQLLLTLGIIITNEWERS